MQTYKKVNHLYNKKREAFKAIDKLQTDLNNPLTMELRLQKSNILHKVLKELFTATEQKIMYYYLKNMA